MTYPCGLFYEPFPGKDSCMRCSYRQTTCACFLVMGRDFGRLVAESVPRLASLAVPVLDSERLQLFYSFKAGPGREVLTIRN